MHGDTTQVVAKRLDDDLASNNGSTIYDIYSCEEDSPHEVVMGIHSVWKELRYL